MPHWERLGRIFTAEDGPSWMCSHASHPVLIPFESEPIRSRIYFTSRDSQNRSHITWLDIDVNNPRHAIAVGESPLLSPGPRGSFDDSGVITSWIVPNEGATYHYYIGWNVEIRFLSITALVFSLSMRRKLLLNPHW